jgi:pimeloyl-ACP methyl ester carboxylesterase
MPDLMTAEPWRFERIVLPGGLGIRAAVAGDGPLVLMLHGFPESWYSWRYQLGQLSQSFLCVAPDLRGYGESDAPRGVQNYTVEALVADVTGLIRHFGRERAVVIGHDWGGAIAWAASLMHSEVVERLIVLNCPHPRQMQRHLRSNFRQLTRSWYIFFFQLPWLPELLLRTRDFEPLMRTMRQGAVNKAAFTDADLEHYRAALRRPYALTAALNYYRALMRRDLLAATRPNHWLHRKVAAPTLIIWGEQDIALGKELTYGMEDLFAGPFEIKYVPDSGHWVQQEKPELVNRLIRDFLSDLRSAA